MAAGEGGGASQPPKSLDGGGGEGGSKGGGCGGGDDGGGEGGGGVGGGDGGGEGGGELEDDSPDASPEPNDESLPLAVSPLPASADMADGQPCVGAWSENEHHQVA